MIKGRVREDERFAVQPDGDYMYFGSSSKTINLPSTQVWNFIENFGANAGSWLFDQKHVQPSNVAAELTAGAGLAPGAKYQLRYTAMKNFQRGLKSIHRNLEYEVLEAEHGTRVRFRLNNLHDMDLYYGEPKYPDNTRGGLPVGKRTFTLELQDQGDFSTLTCRYEVKMAPPGGRCTDPMTPCMMMCCCAYLWYKCDGNCRESAIRMGRHIASGEAHHLVYNISRAIQVSGAQPAGMPPAAVAVPAVPEVMDRGPSGDDDVTAKLASLAEMKQKGLLDDDEFKQAKQKVLQSTVAGPRI